MIVKVVRISDEGVTFDNGMELFSHHDTDCCESHYLWFRDLTLDDFEGLEFNISSDNFFERVAGYGIALKPIFGHPVRVPGYGSNNGYYSDTLTLVLGRDGKFVRTFDITDCQDITGEE